MDFCEKRVFKAPQNLVHSAGHEQFNTQAVYVHGNNSSQEEGVGVQLVHYCLRKTDKENNATIRRLEAKGESAPITHSGKAHWVISCIFLGLLPSVYPFKKMKMLQWKFWEHAFGCHPKSMTFLLLVIEIHSLTTNGMLTVLTMSTCGSPTDFSGTKTKVFGFKA